MKNMQTMTAITLLLAALLVSAGCATTQPTVSTSGEYRKMLELQKQKNQAADKEMAQKKLPEMSAEDHDAVGDRYFRQGDHTHAFLEYRRAVAMNPELLGTRYKLGRLYLEKGLSDEALKEFGTIARKNPANGLARLGRGMVFFRKGDLQAARSEFENALSLDGSLWQAHASLGLILDRESATSDEGRMHYNKGIALNPGSVELYNNLGMSYYLKGDYTQAIAAYGKALRIDPSNRRVANNLGLALGKAGAYGQAFDAFRKGQNTAGAYNNMGFLYLTERRYAEAAEALEKAIDLNPAFYVKAQENMEMVVAEGK
jgi:Flp pilus assembly protein TadD